MDTLIKHPTEHTTAKVNLSSEDMDNISDTFKPFVTEGQVSGYIDNLNISSETKVILNEVKALVINIKGKLVKVGLKIIETIIYLIKKYPNTIMGLLIGLAFGLLLSSIPLIGWIIGPIITPLSAALGLAYGYMTDVDNIGLKNGIDSHISEVFGAIKNVKIAD